jgi:hypothetical protein
VTIVQMERINPAKPVQTGSSRQTGLRDGAPQIDFY